MTQRTLLDFLIVFYHSAVGQACTAEGSCLHLSSVHLPHSHVRTGLMLPRPCQNTNSIETVIFHLLCLFGIYQNHFCSFFSLSSTEGVLLGDVSKNTSKCPSTTA